MVLPDGKHLARSTKTESGYVGVTQRGSGWMSKAHVEGKERYIGTFNTKVEAAQARSNFLQQRRAQTAEEHSQDEVKPQLGVVTAPSTITSLELRGDKHLPRSAKNQSGFMGVSQVRSGWMARACIEGKERYFGTFNTKVEAAQARSNFLQQRRAQTAEEHSQDEVKPQLAVFTAPSITTSVELPGDKHLPMHLPHNATNESGFDAVTQTGSGWMSKAHVEGKERYIGSSKSKVEAAQARSNFLQQQRAQPAEQYSQNGAKFQLGVVTAPRTITSPELPGNTHLRRSATNESGFVGVFQNGTSCWNAQACIDKQTVKIGTFDSQVEAARARRDFMAASPAPAFHPGKERVPQDKHGQQQTVYNAADARNVMVMSGHLGIAQVQLADICRTRAPALSRWLSGLRVEKASTIAAGKAAMQWYAETLLQDILT